ncbi:MAG: hypothetical protein EU541_06120, partial [Promethearchaeota archaeon]
TLKPKERLWYRRVLELPSSWEDNHILLHFGAVDWEATVWVNGERMGQHRGGYTPFSFDITDYIYFSEENEIIVAVWDPTNKKNVIRGKQTLRPWFIKYTAVSGIWQSVWLEPVPETYIESMKLMPDIDNSKIQFQLSIQKPNPKDELKCTISDNGINIVEEVAPIKQNYEFKIPNQKLWSPKTPFLYDLTLEIIRDKRTLDLASSYFGMRKIALENVGSGKKKILLNNDEIFQFGPLDQGYWPDGLYTAPTDEALKYDIQISKELGFNMIRKHVKVEPARWYYHCDKLGMLVWQDMPNGGKMGILSIFLDLLRKDKQHEHKLKKYQKDQFYQELKEMISLLYNHPSIIEWIPFNEGWGQFDTEKVVKFVKKLDSSRLINSASGWFDHGVGDICDCHEYVGPAMPKGINGRAPVCGEFGGLGLEIKDHIWEKKFKFVYQKLENAEELTRSYSELISELKMLKKNGLTAGVYTQLTDVEGEINGLLTYDREIIKINKNVLRDLNTSIIEPKNKPK